MTDIMRISAELDNQGAAESDMLQYFKEEVQAGLLRLRPKVLAYARELVGEALADSPEWHSLLGGDLRLEFGLADASPVLGAIRQAVEDSVHIDLVDSGDAGLGGYSIYVLRDDYAEILSVPGTSYQSKSGLVDWLNWLLFAGSNIVLSSPNIEFRVYNHNFKNSRTGAAVMIHRNPGRFVPPDKPQPRPVEPYRVDPRFAGTAESNWFTRTLRPLEEPLANYVLAELERI